MPIPRTSDPSPDEPDPSISYFLAHEAEIEERERHWTQRGIPLCLGILTMIGTLLLVPGALGGAAAARQSDQTQQHGTQVTAQVTSVVNHSHAYLSGGSGGYLAQFWARWYRADIHVDLSIPVDGRTQTTAYSSKPSTLNPGTTITVVVDPTNAAYAELPGQPLQQPHTWIVLAVISGFLVLLDVLWLTALGLNVAAIVLGRRRRR